MVMPNMNRSFFTLFLLSFFLCISVNLCSVIRTVSPDSTMQYTRIQTAIDASVSGDTVLVYPGRYRTNVFFNGKNILLTSLYLYNPSDSIITQTIIDGHQNEACANFVNGETYQATLNGFTLENGSGYFGNGYRGGGGVYIKTSFATIKNCLIQNNNADFDGGGLLVACLNSNEAGVVLSGNTIRNNWSYKTGGVSIMHQADVFFDSVNLNHIYNNHGGTVHDLAILNASSYNIPLGTASCSELNGDYIFTAFPCTYFAQQSLIQFINHDLYVSPDGDDNNSGLSFAEPLKTIAKAFERIESDSLNPKKVFLAPGIYSRSGNNQIFPVNLKKWVDLIGVSPEETIIDCEGSGGVFVSFERDHDFKITNISIRNIELDNPLRSYNKIAIKLFNPKNITIDNCLFLNCLYPAISRDSYRSDYYPENTSLKIKNVIIDGYNNFPIALTSVKYLEVDNLTIKNSIPNLNEDIWIAPSILGVSPIAGWFGIVKMSNVLIENNHNSITNWPTNLCTSGFFFSGFADYYISNMTITNNTSVPAGGVIKIINSGNNIHFYNCLIYGNSPNQIWFEVNPTPTQPNHAYFNNCLIQGGQNAIRFEGTLGNYSHWGTGNLNTNPLFSGNPELPYTLSANSPCINAGLSNIPNLSLPDTDLEGNPRITGQYIDIGAYEYQLQPIDFTASIQEGNAPLNVQFTSISEDGITWAWDFNNDGSVDSEEQNPIHVFQQTGIYSVKLTINGNQSLLKENYIHVNPSGNQDNPTILFDALSPASPNPFSNQSSINMSIKEAGIITLDIYNVKGQKVKTLYHSAMPSSSSISVCWDGKDKHNQRVSSGLYYLVMKKNQKIIQIQKVVRIK